MKRIIKPYTAKCQLLPAGEKLVACKNIIKSNQKISFTADITSLGEGNKLIVGHGYMKTHGSWVEITADGVVGHSYFSYATPPLKTLNKEELFHGIKITDFITVCIDFCVNKNGADVIIVSAGGTYKCFLPAWYCSDGEVLALFEGLDARNCVLNWSSDDFAKPIWLVGDSYIGTGSDVRWPYYLVRDGYHNLLMCGFPGMGSRRGIDELKATIDRGQPEFIVWCLGMNNADKSENEINPEYLLATEEFLALCKERGITPILSTIPNTPKVENRVKNAWVRSSGYRYIDFARAVGAVDDARWYDEMLSTDQVHPIAKGAAALYSQVLVDFPEIMQQI